jgi:hypothetical protein
MRAMKSHKYSSRCADGDSVTSVWLVTGGTGGDWAVASATTARLWLIAADKSRKIRLPILEIAAWSEAELQGMMCQDVAAAIRESAGMKARVIWELDLVEIIVFGDRSPAR